MGNDTHGGGGIILARADVPCRQIPLSSNLYVVTARVGVSRPRPLCPSYNPLVYELYQQKLEALIAELPTTFLLIGNMNGHNFLRGSIRYSTRGK